MRRKHSSITEPSNIRQMITTQINIIERNTAQLLQLPDAAVFDLRLDLGQYFLSQIYDSEEIRQALSTSRAFWNWWRMAWATADMVLVQQVKTFKKGITYKYHEPGTPEDWKVTKALEWAEVYDWYAAHHADRVSLMEIWPPDEVVSIAMSQTYAAV